MTPDLPALKAALAAAPRGQWEARITEPLGPHHVVAPRPFEGQPDAAVYIAECGERTDARLLALLHNAAPDLIAELERLREAVQAADALAERMEEMGGTTSHCADCAAWFDMPPPRGPQPHNPSCALAAYRAARGRT